jgi:hypothetical protein
MVVATIISSKIAIISLIISLLSLVISALLVYERYSIKLPIVFLVKNKCINDVLVFKVFNINAFYTVMIDYVLNPFYNKQRTMDYVESKESELYEKIVKLNHIILNNSDAEFKVYSNQFATKAIFHDMSSNYSSIHYYVEPKRSNKSFFKSSPHFYLIVKCDSTFVKKR